MRTSDETNEITAALSEAQADIKPAIKDADNPFFKSRYATLDSCWQSIREPLSKNGLALIQAPGYEDGLLTLTTRLAHNSGQWIETTLGVSLPDSKNPVQSMGSTITYLRRYSLSLVGLTTDDDDDGNDAGDADPAQVAKPKNGKAPQTPPQLLALLNKDEVSKGFYQDTPEMLEAIKNSHDPDYTWPQKADVDGWRLAYRWLFSVAEAKTGAR